MENFKCLVFTLIFLLVPILALSAQISDSGVFMKYTQNSQTEENWDYRAIQFQGNQENRTAAIDLLDKALKTQGNFGVYGNLSCGVTELQQTGFAIEITEENEYYSVSIYLLNAQGGYDFSFIVDKKTGQLSNIAVGNIEPPPKYL